MDRRKMQCTSWFGRNRRSREEHLKYTLNRTKSGGDRIRGGKGMESPRNHQAREGGAPSRLGFTLGHRWEEKGEKEFECGLGKWSKGFIPKRSDLSGRMLDRTCSVRYGFSGLE
jgi:hypothetical protein